jgi:hypothetical protein
LTHNVLGKQLQENSASQKYCWSALAGRRSGPLGSLAKTVRIIPFSAQFSISLSFLEKIQILPARPSSTGVKFQCSYKEQFMPKTLEKNSAQAKKPHTAKGNPSTDEIALRAYHIFIERGAAPGNELDDWIRAERELIANSSQSSRKSKSKSATS